MVTPSRAPAASSHQGMHQVRQLAARLPARRLELGGFRPKPVPVLGPPVHHPLRCYASKNDGVKSWAEIANEAATVAKDLARKVGTGISSAVSAVIPSKEERAVQQREREEREQRELYREPGFGGGGGLIGGLVGRALGKMVQSALGAVGEQMRQAAEQVADVQSRAQAVIEGSAQLQERLGGSVRCMAPISQSSMTQNINGQVQRVVSLVLPVVGGSGRAAQAQVQWVEGGEGDTFDVSVRLASGEVLRLGGGGGGGPTKTIDVEWRNLD